LKVPSDVTLRDGPYFVRISAYLDDGRVQESAVIRFQVTDSGNSNMHAFAEYALCLVLVACAALTQSATPPTSGQALLEKGKQLYTQAGPKAALPQFEEALEIFRSNGDRQREAVTLGYIANCHRKLGDLDQALEFAQRALRMKQDLGDRGEVGNTHSQLGLIYWERADYPAATRHLDEAVKIASAVGDKELEERHAIISASCLMSSVITSNLLSSTSSHSIYIVHHTLSAAKATR
jgi:tetratricopeptide (TPR) repeat protein